MPGAIIVNPENNCAEVADQTKYYQGALLDFFAALASSSGMFTDAVKEKFAALFVVQVAKFSYIIGTPQNPIAYPTQVIVNGTNVYQFPSITGKDIFVWQDGQRILQNSTGFSRTGLGATITFAYPVTDSNIEILAIEPFSVSNPYLPFILPHNL